MLEVHGDEILIRLPLKMSQRAAGRPIEIPQNLLLTPREREVFVSLTQGKCNKDIAEQMNISVRTVKFHVSGLMRKLGIESRHEVHTMEKPQ
jgi:DNA-binding NarL/FixJ family response regulator